MWLPLKMEERRYLEVRVTSAQPVAVNQLLQKPSTGCLNLKQEEKSLRHSWLPVHLEAVRVSGADLLRRDPTGTENLMCDSSVSHR